MGSSPFYPGKTFGHWTMLEDVKGRKGYWLCRCTCGAEREVCSSSLSRGMSKSCGCRRSEAIRDYGRDISGAFFGLWEVIKPVESDRNGAKKYLCRCKCGTEKAVYKGHLVGGRSRSCGCLKKEFTRDKHPQWGGYGEISGNQWNTIERSASGRIGKRHGIQMGIDIRYAWELFESQKRRCALSGVPLVMGEDASLDRVDSSLGYVEGNVQWVHRDVNMMKRTYSQEYFVRICRQIADHTREITLDF